MSYQFLEKAVLSAQKRGQSLVPKALSLVLVLSLSLGIAPTNLAWGKSVDDYKSQLDLAVANKIETSSALDAAKAEKESADSALLSSQEDVATKERAHQDACDVFSSALGGAIKDAEDKVLAAKEALDIATQSLAEYRNDHMDAIASIDMESLAQLKQDISVLESKITAEAQALQEKKASKEDKESEKAEQSRKIADLQAEIEEFEAQVLAIDIEALDGAVENAEKEYKDAEEQVAELQAAYDGASSKASVLMRESNSLNAQFIAAKTEKETAASEQKAAESAYEDYRAQNGLTDEQDVLSLKDYLVSKGSTFAVQLMERRFGENGIDSEVDHMTYSGAPNDATDYRNVIKALQTIKATNKIRESLGLSTLLVSDALMAKEAASVNWSSFHVTHSEGCGMENLAHVQDQDPVPLWYDREKAIYEEAVTYNTFEGEPLPSDWQEKGNIWLADNGYDKFLLSIGHYLNLKEPEHQYVGAALNTSGEKYPRVYGQLYLDDNGDGEYAKGAVSVEEWEASFMAWVESQLENRQDIVLFDAVRTAQEKSAAAVSAYNDIMSRAFETQQAYQKALSDKSEYLTRLNAAKEELSQKQLSQESAQGEYESACGEVERLNGEIRQKRDMLAGYEEALSAIEAEISAIDDTLSEAETAVQADEERLESLKEESDIASTLLGKEEAVDDARAGAESAEGVLAALTTYDRDAAFAGKGIEVPIEDYRYLNDHISALSKTHATLVKARIKSVENENAVALAEKNLTDAQGDYSDALKAEQDAERAYDDALRAENQRTDLSAAGARLASSSMTYTGKTVTPSVQVGTKTLVQGRDYTLTRTTKCVSVGKQSVTIQGIGAYKGSVVLSFDIVPEKAAIKKLVSASKKITVKIKNVPSGADGVKVSYSTKKSFASAKSATISKKAVSKALTGLAKAKKYYVKARSYKKVGGKTYYSAWSAVKSVKTK